MRSLPSPYSASGCGRIWKRTISLVFPLPPLAVPVRHRVVAAPQAAALPAGVGIVDAPVEAARVEAERIRHAHDDPLAALRKQREQRVGTAAAGHRHVRAEAERVELIDPVVVVEVGVGRPGHPAHPGTRGGVQRPALRAVLARGVGSVQDRALAAVEARQVAAAAERGPRARRRGRRRSRAARSPSLPGRRQDSRTAARRPRRCRSRAGCHPDRAAGWSRGTPSPAPTSTRA